METNEDIKGKILEAAMARFIHYGFHKTTMAEIAKDCGMSAANLYRFFQNKAEIIVTLALNHFEVTWEKMEAIVGNRTLASAEKLESFFVHLFRCNRDLLREKPNISEVVEFFLNERPDIVKEMVSREIVTLEKILVDGNDSGEFAIEDTAETARNFRMAFTPFIVTPFLLHIMDNKVIDHGDLETRLKSLLKLLLKGISASN
ncbi:MAG: TetR/AcrR family transcriptional regulator [Nitrospinota bacterium]|nr:TetR/AcrR family transcriptional regulator [Nitrospinota bacterium]